MGFFCCSKMAAIQKFGQSYWKCRMSAFLHICIWLGSLWCYWPTGYSMVPWLAEVVAWKLNLTTLATLATSALLPTLAILDTLVPKSAMIFPRKAIIFLTLYYTAFSQQANSAKAMWGQMEKKTEAVSCPCNRLQSRERKLTPSLSFIIFHYISLQHCIEMRRFNE